MNTPTEADRRALKKLNAPLFRCRGGWKRGAVKITTATASRLIARGLARKTTARNGQMMLVPSSSNEPPQQARYWWQE